MNLDSESPALPILRAWPQSKVVNGFLGRRGGASRGRFATLNLSWSVGDEPAAVAENWRRLCSTLRLPNAFARLEQVHGNVVRVVGHGDAGRIPVGDAMVTAAAGLMLGIFTADCVPLLMVDSRRRVAGAVHGGWRSVLGGIVARTVEQMEKLGAVRDRIDAALGPAIGACCFEVDAELADRFAAKIPEAGRHARTGAPGKALLDLRGIIAGELRREGLTERSVVKVGPCTKCESTRYFSRRAAGGQATGLQLSYVGFGA